MDLPSFNLSKRFDIGNSEEAQKLLKQFCPSNGTSQVVGTSRNHTAHTNGISSIHIEEQDYKGQYLTINPDEIMDDPDPELYIKVRDKYSRFRYESEKTKERKRNRTDSDDPDKQCLAELSVNFSGTAKVIVHCVDGSGNIHPFHLFGNNCNNGVYVRRFKFRPEKVLRLTGVSVTMPTTKNSSTFIDKKCKYLGVLNIREKTTPPKGQDKQMVYLKFIVEIEDTKQQVTGISTALCNRKQGKEFLIDCVMPPSAPASGPVIGNRTASQILIVVTNHTHFPQEVGVIFRERNADGNVIWEKIVHEKDKNVDESDFEVVKKAVIKLVPPAYGRPEIQTDVDVELRLCDMKTNTETDPVPFIYRGSDVYGIEQKGKKRKLDQDEMYKRRITGTVDKAMKRQAVSHLRKHGEDDNESSSDSDDDNIPPANEIEIATSTVTSEMSTINDQQVMSQSYTPTVISDPQPSTSTAPYQTARVTSDYNAVAVDHQPQQQQMMPQDQQLTGEVLAGIVDQLGPNQQIALINGQICIINDDTANNQQTSDSMLPSTVEPTAVSINQQTPAPQLPSDPPLLSSLNSANLARLYESLGPQTVAELLMQQIANIQQASQNQTAPNTMQVPTDIQTESNEPYDNLDDDDLEMDSEEREGQKPTVTEIEAMNKANNISNVANKGKQSTSGKPTTCKATGARTSQRLAGKKGKS